MSANKDLLMGFRRHSKKFNVVQVDFFKNLFTYRNVDLTYKKDKKIRFIAINFARHYHWALF